MHLSNYNKSNVLSSRFITAFHSIIVTLCWFPSPDFDETYSSSFYTTTSLSFLRSQSQSFCREVDYLHQIDAEMGYLIGKPSFHRFIELINHTILTFGPVRMFSEMPFETANQTLKSALKYNTCQKKHLTCIYNASCAD